MTESEGERSDRPPARLEFLDGLRALAILLVVGVHGTAYVPLDSATARWVDFVVHTISVPTFFLCDGYLLAHAAARGKHVAYRAYLASSARRLLVPWVIFSVVYTAARAVFEGIGVLDERTVLDQSMTSILLRIYGSGIAPQLYFLLSLFVIRCAAPLWRRLVAAPIAVHVSVFVFYTITFRHSASDLQEIFSVGNDPIRHALWGLQFFFAGALLFRLRGVSSGYYGHLAVVGGVMLATAIGMGRAPDWFLQYCYLASTFFFFAGLPHTPHILAAAGRDTMGIYLLHAPIPLKFFGLVARSALPPSLMSYLIVVFAAFGASWLLMRVLMKLPGGPVLFGILGNDRT